MHWREACLIVGICVFVYAASGFDGEVYFHDPERLLMSIGAGIAAVGLLALRRRTS